ncbi:MAG TPA: hypothetical protein DEV87_01440 [Clostridiales bacterium]|nr:hypothetical protein [Clostridiales bacterium]
MTFRINVKVVTIYKTRLDYQNDCKLKQVIADGTPFVYFASIQDLRGSTRVGGKFNKNNAVFDTDWDLLIIDEAHEGTATDLGDAVINNIRKPNTKVLLLSGTPYNILSDFGENKYTWTYVDEQKAKKAWDEDHPDERNPYEELPKMNIFTFDLSEKIPTSYRYVTEDSAFNFREFFRTWTGDKDKDFREIPEGQTVGDFVYADDVYDFLALISKDDPDSNYPFSTEEYREMFAHTFWILPGIKEAKALSAMIQNHPNFKDFEVVNIAGDGDEEKPYDEALALVKSCIKSYSKTITISCGKLTTGVTVREWTGIMMLSGSSTTSAQGYMQAIFRVQSPGYINGKQKKNCYVFDFAPDRTLKVIAEVHRVTHKSSQSDEKAKSALGEFINFCPIISVEGTAMRTYDVAEMMRQIKRISVETAINSGFDDDTIYIADAGMNLTEVDAELLRKLSDVVSPKKKGQKQNEVDINKYISSNLRNLRFLSPAESMNALTIGAIFSDGNDCTPAYNTTQLCTKGMPAIYSSFGRGINNSVKPDILFDGGRSFIREVIPSTANSAIWVASPKRKPGILSAYPGPQQEGAGTVAYSFGTSNSAALISNKAEECFNILNDVYIFCARLPK